MILVSPIARQDGDAHCTRIGGEQWKAGAGSMLNPRCNTLILSFPPKVE